ncbi:microfibril-associated glycoprotein 4-like [Lucilia sericata]|uniref:microfibril-associated glycoprotein 4-like n=1 Tax=Lucilia sericata TaxID=13632 RepID=UPI0018A845DF|nr:microfibril-associated glycoprotein 4-like [Lucilia sericata]
MKIKHCTAIKLLILILLNIIYFVKSSSVLNKNDFAVLEGSGLDADLIPLNHFGSPVSPYEQNVIIMEEKIKFMAETFNQLEQKISSLINDNMELLEDKFQKIMDDKVTNMNKIVEEKIKMIGNSKPSYNVQELKCSDNRLPKSCHDLNECHNNIYSIMLPEISNKSFPAVCDLKTVDGGWTIIQRRQDGSENFFRNWTDYVEGFGNLNGEFFIGLEKLYSLTSLDEPQELYISLQDFEGETRYARYGQFKVDSASTDYTLTVGDYSGDASDCLSQHSGNKFSTKDRDNDIHNTRNCADYWKGAWWYSNCFYSNLNGLYLAGKIPSSKRGISWCGFRKYLYSLKSVQMMIRPKRD